MTDLSTLTVDDLADGICLRAGRIAAAQAELLRWIADLDRREGWAGPGMLSCAHWLSWRVGLSLGTARDQVRVARRLEELPEIAAAFGDGRVSYSKVRAITRVAEPDDGIDWVALARHSSAAQLDKLARGVERARAHPEAERDPEVAAWRLRTRTRYDEQGNFVLTISGPAQLLPVVRAGLDAKKAELQRERDAAAPDERAGVAAEVPGATGAGQELLPDAASAPAGPATPAPSDVSAEAPAAASSADLPAEPDLDAQAPGWPTGTTLRQLHEAMGSFTSLQGRLAAEQAPLRDDAPSSPPEQSPSPQAPVPPVVPVPRQATEDLAPADPEPATVTDADALLALAQDALAAEQRSRPDAARRRRPQLTGQVDPLTGWARQVDGELLPPTSLQQVMKTFPGRGGVVRLRPLSTADLRRHDLGRTAREANAALRELLGALDGERCRFPGCTRHRKLHAHHVVYWSDGGPTDLANLALVCSRHHTLLHQHGFQLTLHPDRRLAVHTADGAPVLHHPAQPWGDPTALANGCGQLVSAETLPPGHCTDRLDLRYAVSVLMAQAA